jgi:LAS superfamily LD-carboxypeptidase LdcB
MKKAFEFLTLIFAVFAILSCNTDASPAEQDKSTITSIEKEPTDASSASEIASDTIAPSKDKLTGRFDYTKDKDFVKVADEYCTKPSYMHKEAYTKFVEMHKAAKKEGVTLKVISGTRNFNEQCGIWNRKWEKYIAQKDSIETMKTILTYSSMPSTSRHHWGTDIDINSLENSYFESGKGLKEYKWLCENAAKYGFCQVYTSKKDSKRTGYEMEKWHWSYLPVATINLQAYNKLITYADVKGFKGAHLANKVKAKEHYVNGIDSFCIK